MDRRETTGEAARIGQDARGFRIGDIRQGSPGFRGRTCRQILEEGSAGTKEEGNNREEE